MQWNERNRESNPWLASSLLSFLMKRLNFFAFQVIWRIADSLWEEKTFVIDNLSLTTQWSVKKSNLVHYSKSVVLNRGLKDTVRGATSFQPFSILLMFIPVLASRGGAKYRYSLPWCIKTKKGWETLFLIIFLSLLSQNCQVFCRHQCYKNCCTVTSNCFEPDKSYFLLYRCQGLTIQIRCHFQDFEMVL